MSIRKDVLELLSQLPGRHAHLESVRFLTDPTSFYQVTPKGDVEVTRPDWLGPEPTIKKISDVPIQLSDAYECAQADELLDVVWKGGDAAIFLSDKGRAALAQHCKTCEIVSDRLKVNLGQSTATLDGTSYDVTSENALLWLKVLVEHPGEWISGRELADGKYGDVYIGLGRPDRLKKYLPNEILSLIKSRTGKGFCLRL